MEIIKPKEEFIAREIDFPDIAEQVKSKIISEKNKNYACNSLWASEAAHDCMRYLVYQQCDWEKAKQVEDNLLLVFHEGNLQEDQLLLELQKAGIKIKDLQINIKISRANITGKLDCIAILENNKNILCNVPIEIKSMSDIVYNSVNTVDDFKKYPWTRKYYGQMMSYLKNDAWFFEFGLFFAKNKSTGAMKLIKDFDGSNAIKFNPEYWEWMVNRGEQVAEYAFNIKQARMKIAKLESQLTGKNTKKEQTLKAKIEKQQAKIVYPERIKYDIKVCKGCKYEHICIAELSDIQGSVIENESIIKAIDEYVQAKENREKYKEAEKIYTNALACLKSLFPLEENVYMCGEKYILQTKLRKMKDTQYLTFEIKNIQ